MKALITGIYGQDGSYLCKLLKEKGYEVIGLARKPIVSENHTYLKTAPDRIYYGCVSEAGLIDYIIRTEQPDEIYNLAAQSHVGLSFYNPLTTMQVNYGGLVNIIQAVKRHGKAKIYQAGTSEMFGSYAVADTFDEKTPFNPMSPYGISKVAAHWAGVNARAEGVWVSNGILFNHESPIRGKDFVTRKITLAAARGETVSLGNVNSKRDWGFAGDYVEGMWLMLQHDKPDDFILATNEVHSVKDVLDITGCKYQISGNNFRPNDLTYLKGDYTKAKALLGWRPKVGFKQLITMMMEADKERV
jgi:GDPmannose 4,6-dehydratase